MILFTLLGLVLLLMLGIAIGFLAVGGAVSMVIFGDVIVCAVFVVLLMRLILKRRKRRK